jgi:hypothetical protein
MNADTADFFVFCMLELIMSLRGQRSLLPGAISETTPGTASPKNGSQRHPQGSMTAFMPFLAGSIPLYSRTI